MRWLGRWFGVSRLAGVEDQHRHAVVDQQRAQLRATHEAGVALVGIVLEDQVAVLASAGRTGVEELRRKAGGVSGGQVAHDPLPRLLVGGGPCCLQLREVEELPVSVKVDDLVRLPRGLRFLQFSGKLLKAGWA